jgi:hypothetical protein
VLGAQNDAVSAYHEPAGRTAAAEFDDASCGASPEKAPQRGKASGVVHGASGVEEMAQADWQPSPGRYLVVLPSPTGGNGGPGGEPGAAAQAERCLTSLAAVFRQERRLAFRRAAVSPALTQLLSAGTGGRGGSQRGTVALVLHPRRALFLLLPLDDARAAALRLEAVLDGGGDWQPA